MNEQRELTILREIESLLNEAKDALLMMEQPDSCNCAKGRMVKVFRCQQAYKIAFKLDQLKNLRGW